MYCKNVFVTCIRHMHIYEKKISTYIYTFFNCALKISKEIPKFISILARNFISNSLNCEIYNFHMD